MLRSAFQVVTYEHTSTLVYVLTLVICYLAS